MNKSILIGKFEFIIIAVFSTALSVLLAFVTVFIVPIVYILLFIALYRGRKSSRTLIVFFNILSAFLCSALAIGDQAIVNIQLCIVLLYLVCSIFLYVGNVRRFIVYQNERYAKKVHK